MVAQTRKRKAAQEQAAEQTVAKPPISTTPKRQKLPMRSKDDESPAQKGAGKGTLITFDDHGQTDKNLTASAPTSRNDAPRNAKEEASEDSDDDAAPEAVSTTKAALDIKKSALAARKVAREQAAAEKRKRQERDALLKKQAEERKQAEEEAKAATAAAGPAQDDDLDDAPSARQRESATRGRKRTDKVQIPKLLPAEFLTDSSSEDDGDGGDADQNSSLRPKKRNVSAVERRLSRQDRGPRDERVGSTVYRVAKAADERLAPKAKKHSKRTKDVLLKRNRKGVKSRAGFFTEK
ncbi:hypothetical protein TOPH_00545 [Tolypocladium ophioglossoides CBS 100239]|uniref:Uncharacterized protein n=1 Tax=Tolypocladium ophioglossoides (strain CBS 100239) TaxID=1163406 RepID=A0A0L0NM62_TOLOC|nr:hypothetical protein TOPH_00545 [Tolypocladium ophioglossoides CBS 100239]